MTRDEAVESVADHGWFPARETRRGYLSRASAPTLAGTFACRPCCAGGNRMRRMGSALRRALTAQQLVSARASGVSPGALRTSSQVTGLGTARSAALSIYSPRQKGWPEGSA